MDLQDTTQPDAEPRPRHAAALFDFRSARFSRDALALQRLTGCSLVLCRQELFIAEGDALEAYQCLVQAAGPGPPAGWVH